jgi:hypothetical protein
MEKRKQPRIDLSKTGWRATLIDKLTGQSLGEVVNLSASGMMLITTTAPQTDSLYQIECRAQGPSDRSIAFDAGVLVLWSSQASEPDTYWLGLQIIDIGSDSKKLMRTLEQGLLEEG